MLIHSPVNLVKFKRNLIWDKTETTMTAAVRVLVEVGSPTAEVGDEQKEKGRRRHLPHSHAVDLKQDLGIEIPRENELRSIIVFVLRQYNLLASGSKQGWTNH